MIDTKIDPRFSDPAASATPWPSAREELGSAKTYWVVTVRRDGRPHVTTTAGVWVEDAIHFATGASEQKARNLAANDHVIMLTGCNGWEGLDVVVEGHAVAVTDAGLLERIARAFTDKYDDFFGFRVTDGASSMAARARPTRSSSMRSAPTRRSGSRRASGSARPGGASAARAPEAATEPGLVSPAA